MGSGCSTKVGIEPLKILPKCPSHKNKKLEYILLDEN